MLHARFEAELTRQAAKAAEAARQAALAVSQMQEAVTGRTQRKKSANNGGIAQTTQSCRVSQRIRAGTDAERRDGGPTQGDLRCCYEQGG